MKAIGAITATGDKKRRAKMIRRYFAATSKSIKTCIGYAGRWYGCLFKRLNAMNIHASRGITRWFSPPACYELFAILPPPLCHIRKFRDAMIFISRHLVRHTTKSIPLLHAFFPRITPLQHLPLYYFLLEDDDGIFHARFSFRRWAQFIASCSHFMRQR